jgi:hypothetical protein
MSKFHLQLLFLSASFMLGAATTTAISYFGDPNVEYNGTWSGTLIGCGNETATFGDSVTLTFTGEALNPTIDRQSHKCTVGTSAAVVGARQAAGGIISIDLDGQNQSNVDDFGNASIVCNQVLYLTPELQNGVHTLTVTLIGASPNEPNGSSPSISIEYFS